MTTVVLSSLLTEAPSNVFCKRKRDAGTHAVMKQGWSHCFARADMHSCFTENAGPSVDTSKRFCHAVLLALAGGPRAGGAVAGDVAPGGGGAGVRGAVPRRDVVGLLPALRHGAPRATRHAPRPHARALFSFVLCSFFPSAATLVQPPPRPPPDSPGGAWLASRHLRTALGHVRPHSLARSFLPSPSASTVLARACLREALKYGYQIRLVRKNVYGGRLTPRFCCDLALLLQPTALPPWPSARPCCSASSWASWTFTLS